MGLIIFFFIVVVAVRLFYLVVALLKIYVNKYMVQLFDVKETQLMLIATITMATWALVAWVLVAGMHLCACELCASLYVIYLLLVLCGFGRGDYCSLLLYFVKFIFV